MADRKYFGPYRSPIIQKKIEDWVKENPDRWYSAKMEDIKVESGASQESLYRYLYLAIAKRAKIRPSVVVDLRRYHMGISPWKRRLRQSEIDEIYRLADEYKSTNLDIAFATGRSLAQVEKVLRRRRKEQAAQAEKEAEDGVDNVE